MSSWNIRGQDWWTEDKVNSKYPKQNTVNKQKVKNKTIKRMSEKYRAQL